MIVSFLSHLNIVPDPAMPTNEIEVPAQTLVGPDAKMLATGLVVTAISTGFDSLVQPTLFRASKV